MHRSRSRKTRGHQIPLFIDKLTQILENKDIEHTIRWTSTLDSFQILNISLFTDQVLPQYFKHQNFSSFIRQLNMYGFRKVRHCDGENVYMNENFKESNKNLLKNITRKLKEQREDKVAIYHGENQPMSRQLNELRIKQNNLEELCKHLIAQNHQLIEENASMLKKIKEDSQDKEKQLEQFLVSILLNQRNQKQLLVGEQEKGLGLIESYKGTALTNSTPLEVLSHSLNRNEQVKIIKNALECAHYGKKAIRRKENNFTIVNPRNEEVEFEHSYSPIPHRPEEGDDFLLEKNDTSLLSANDFLDADGYDEINLDESR